jgi:CubicO group peptidase (beta-lactamase class C family)
VRRALVSAFAAACLTAGVLAQAPAPDTVAGRQLRAWLAVFNGADRAARQQFYKDHWAYTPNQNFYEDLLQQTGGFELIRIEESTGTRSIALARQIDADALSRLTFEVEPEAPNRIVRFTAQPVPRPPDLAIQRLSEAELLTTLRADLDRRAKADRFSGTVLIARNGKAIFTAAYGFADRERTIPNSVGTRFRNGSMSKMFTAVAVLSLIEAGMLALDDTLLEHLPDYANKTLASKVTVHHLLTHTGGTGDIFGALYNEHRLELRTHQDFVNLFGARNLTFEPGSQWAYSNYGFVLLGAIIEKVSGQSYYDYVRDRVFARAGMVSTASDPEDALLPNSSLSYTRRPGTSGWQRAEMLGYRGMAAGGGLTTVEDLLRFSNALMNHTLLSAGNTALLTTGKVKSGAGMYAYGFGDMTINGVRAIGHSGGAPGQTGDLLILPESGYVVAVLANLDPPLAPRISNFIANRLPE